MTQQSVIVWFRHDLRLGDNPALTAALETGLPIIPVFIWAPKEEEPWPPGGASRWWLHHSLTALNADLVQAGSRLIFRHGPTLNSLRQIIKETGASAVFWNRRCEPRVRERDAAIAAALRAEGARVDDYSTAVLWEPGTIRNQAGKPFRVFTPFWRHCLTLPEPAESLPAPARLAVPSCWPSSIGVEALDLLPKLDWAAGLRAAWRPGVRGASASLEGFLANGLSGYDTNRDFPAQQGTSRLSPHLHFGELSARQVWHAVKKRLLDGNSFALRPRDSAKTAVCSTRKPGSWTQTRFLTELGWREFAHHLLHHFPHTDREPLRPEFMRFRWRTNDELLAAWRHGTTGFPIVDAGMRELWTTGWMHNRVRMIVASFLVKDLLIAWQEGARWFWDTLVDADLAQNSFGWQWSAGCGADAAPFFRVFNPALQGEKFDPSGAYVCRWVPELAALPNRWIHQPQKAPVQVLSQAGVELGKTYPAPVISHTIAREVALEAFARLKT